MFLVILGSRKNPKTIEKNKSIKPLSYLFLTFATVTGFIILSLFRKME